jgi:DNA-binding protein Fis
LENVLLTMEQALNQQESILSENYANHMQHLNVVEHTNGDDRKNGYQMLLCEWRRKLLKSIVSNTVAEKTLQRAMKNVETLR